MPSCNWLPQTFINDMQTNKASPPVSSTHSLEPSALLLPIVSIISLMQSHTLSEATAGQGPSDSPADLYSQRLRTLEVAAQLPTRPLHLNGDEARSEQA